MSIRADLKRLMREKRQEGWEITQGKKHWKWKSPDGTKILYVSGTPSDHRFMTRLKLDLRRKPLASAINQD